MLPRPTATLANPLLLPPLTLAYIGDAVYEVFVRDRLLALGVVRVDQLHKSSIKYVRARAQAGALAEMHPTLTPDEQDVVRRGRNAKGHAAPKGSDAPEYAASTAFETLVGYLYMSDQAERLAEFLHATAKHLEKE